MGPASSVREEWSAASVKGNTVGRAAGRSKRLMHRWPRDWQAHDILSEAGPVFGLAARTCQLRRGLAIIVSRSAWVGWLVAPAMWVASGVLDRLQGWSLPFRKYGSGGICGAMAVEDEPHR